MAILSKIRERSLFLIIVIGLALFAFVLDPSSISDFFSSSKVNQIGEVNGETISRQKFAQALERYKQQAGGRVSEMQAAKTVWSNMLKQKVYENQLNESGITIGEADIMSALYDVSFVKQDPRFQTSGIFDKDKLKEHLATIKSEDNDEWKSWKNYMVSLKENVQKTTYDNLVGAGLGASLKEGELQYLSENTNVSGDFVYVPYTSVADSLVSIKKSEVEAYINKHQDEFKVEATRDIKYVKFDIKPTAADTEAVKTTVASIINDSEVSGAKILGLKNTTDYKTFFAENNSDTPFNESVQYKSGVSSLIAEEVFNGSVNDTFGPYTESGFVKVSKITEVLNLPDSVKASHILIPFQGSSSASAETIQTEEQAKNTADSLAVVVRRNTAKFADLAKEFSSDKSNSEKGGELDWFTYNRMVPSFRDYCFNNKKGDIGVVKSQFGFHVIKIDGQKNYQKAVKLVTFSRAIEASEETESVIYQNAETIAQELNNGTNFDEVVKTKELTSKSAVGLKALDENIVGIGKEREIITWAFEKDVNVGDFKRFDVEGGYVVATLTDKTAKGLMPVDKAITKVRPILTKEKKAVQLKESLSGATLDEIAKSSGQKVRRASDVNLKSPTISGVGFEPKVVGAMLNAKENQLYNSVVGDKGVFAFVVSKRELPTALPNYETYRNRLASQRKTKTYNMYEAIKKASNVEDNLSSFYGVE